MPSPLPATIALTAALFLSAALAGCQSNTSNPSAQPIKPSAKLSTSPGAPMTIEEVQERSANSPRTVPVVRPAVTNPTPTVTKTPIPTQPFGLVHKDGQAGGPLGNTEASPSVAIYGNGGNARNIAFVIDASGSMVDLLPLVIREVKRVTKEIQLAQSLTIIVYSGKGVYEVPGRVKGPRKATPEFKEQIDEWLTLSNANFSTGGHGGKHIEAALIQTLRYRPELVFLMSDNLTGGGQGATQHEVFQDKLLKTIVKHNDSKTPAKFNTIQFLHEDPLVKAGLTGTMQRIADDTGGRYKFVSAKDLNLK